jgi:hypothetical protein
MEDLKMSHLKKENIEKCFTLLKDFIDESQGLSSKKGIASLALNQLKRITAGTNLEDDFNQIPATVEGGTLCVGRPRADLDPNGGNG